MWKIGLTAQRLISRKVGFFSESKPFGVKNRHRGATESADNSESADDSESANEQESTSKPESTDKPESADDPDEPNYFLPHSVHRTVLPL